MALTAKADLGGHLGQRLAGFQQPLRLTDAHALHVSVRRQANFRPERAQQVVRAERHVGCQLGQADPLGKAFIDIGAGALYGSWLFTQPLFAQAQVGIALDELG